MDILHVQQVKLLGDAKKGHPGGKNGQQGEINKVLPCVHFVFAVNVAGGIGLRVAEK